MMASLGARAYPLLLSPLTVGRHVLRNRLVMGSMHTRLEYEPNGIEKQAAFFAERARGGVALIVTGGVSPNRAGRVEPEGQTLERPDQFNEHRPIVEAVHEHGAKILLQVLHTGAYAKHDDIVGVSDVRSPINSRVPRRLSSEEMEQTAEEFVRCCELAMEAGYDGVEFMGSEGYFLTQCVTERMNDRTDEWGGSSERRIRFPVEVARRARARLGPDALLAYRISAVDFVADGQSTEEIDLLAVALERAGIDVLNTGIGWHESLVPTIAYQVPRGAFAYAAKRLKSVVGIPVVASNRINTPEVAESILASGVDLVSMARPLLADPDFVNKVTEGRTDEINTCIACNQACLDYIFTERVASCLVNPRACHETEYPDRKAERSLNVAVVGAGPAGMSFAINAAARGHTVTIFDAGTDIGGQINLARRIPGKTEFNEMLRYLRGQLARHEVTIRLNTRVTAADLAGGSYDHVVLATGILPRTPNIPGVDHPSVVSYVDVISGRATVGERVGIIGTGGIGHDVAELLTANAETVEDFNESWGVDTTMTARGGLREPKVHRAARTVTLLQRSTDRPGSRLGKSTGWIHRTELRRRGVAAIPGCTYRRIDDDGLHYTLDGVDRLLEVDTIVLCAGQDPNQELATDLSGKVPISLIGGARYATELDAARAMDEGLRLAYEI